MRRHRPSGHAHGRIVLGRLPGSIHELGVLGFGAAGVAHPDVALTSTSGSVTEML
jgi:hypothetical protein